MAIDQRQFLRSLALGLGASGQGLAAADALVADGPLLASAYRRNSDHSYGVAICDARGTLLKSTVLPGRGHACVFKPDGSQVLAFARRPGRFMQVIDVHHSRPVLQINSEPGRHFFGHGCFDASGKLLYTTENDYEHARGVIGVYDASANYRRVTEFQSFGVGPHELLLHPDGNTLIVANGGIETHPD